jgi:hypothetical protein
MRHTLRWIRTSKTTTSITITAIVAVVALLGVVIMVTLVNIPQQQAEARGYENSIRAAVAMVLLQLMQVEDDASVIRKE